MTYGELAEKGSVVKTGEALRGKGYEVMVVKTGQEAMAKIIEIIPEGKSVMNGSSTTLDQIGFMDYLKSGQHKWNNLHGKILEEKDPEKQALARRQSVLSDYYLGSVHALIENGEFIIASNTGSQLPHVVNTSPNLIFVVSTKKIVGSLDEAFRRLEDHVVPLENKRMMEKYNMGTSLNKILIFKGDAKMLQRKIQFILVEEDLGF